MSDKLKKPARQRGAADEVPDSRPVNECGPISLNYDAEKEVEAKLQKQTSPTSLYRK
jgi:hypothetical protein